MKQPIEQSIATYLLQYSKLKISGSQAAKALGIHKQTFAKWLFFWQEKGLLSFTSDKSGYYIELKNEFKERYKLPEKTDYLPPTDRQEQPTTYHLPTAYLPTTNHLPIVHLLVTMMKLMLGKLDTDTEQIANRKTVGKRWVVENWSKSGRNLDDLQKSALYNILDNIDNSNIDSIVEEIISITNISITNISTTNIFKPETKKRKAAKPKAEFTPPELQEVQDYALTLIKTDGLKQRQVEQAKETMLVDAELFFIYWSEQDWQRKNKPMRSWQLSFKQWLLNKQTYGTGRNTNQSGHGEGGKTRRVAEVFLQFEEDKQGDITDVAGTNGKQGRIGGNIGKTNGLADFG